METAEHRRQIKLYQVQIFALDFETVVTLALNRSIEHYFTRMVDISESLQALIVEGGERVSACWEVGPACTIAAPYTVKIHNQLENCAPEMVSTIQQKLEPAVKPLLSMLGSDDVKTFLGASAALCNMVFLNHAMAAKVVLGGGIRTVVRQLVKIRESKNLPEHSKLQQPLDLLNNVVAMTFELHMRLVEEVRRVCILDANIDLSDALHHFGLYLHCVHVRYRGYLKNSVPG